MTDSSNEIPTTIGVDAVFKGEIRFEKGLKLLGKFEGQIESGGQLIIGEGATLNGNAKAGTIRVDGQVQGNLNADSKVQLTTTARLEGDLQAARLEVAEGAIVAGRFTVGVDDAKSKPTEQIKSMPAESVGPPKSKAVAAAPQAVKK